MQNEKTNWVTQKRKADADIETTTKSCCGFSPLCEKNWEICSKIIDSFLNACRTLEIPRKSYIDLQMRKQMGV